MMWISGNGLVRGQELVSGSHYPTYRSKSTVDLIVREQDSAMTASCLENAWLELYVYIFYSLETVLEPEIARNS